MAETDKDADKASKAKLDPATAKRLGLDDKGSPVIDHLNRDDAEIVAAHVGGTVVNLGVAFHVSLPDD